MATLIPTTRTTSFDGAGKRRLAKRMEQMRSDDSLWHTVRVGPKQPVSCGRDEQAPIIKLPILCDEGFAIADPLSKRTGPMQAAAPRTQTQRRYNPGTDAIQVMTMKVRKGLEFPVVALADMGHMQVGAQQARRATT